MVAGNHRQLTAKRLDRLNHIANKLKVSVIPVVRWSVGLAVTCRQLYQSSATLEPARPA
jgi:hypothetical protein